MPINAERNQRARQKLLTALKTGRTFCFTGAGISWWAGYKLWSGVLEDLAAEVNDQYPGEHNTDNALKAITTGIQNTVHGEEALKSETTGTGNTAHGYQTLMKENGGSNNTAIGTQAGMNLATGVQNILLGFQAGSAYDSAETKNILLNHTGMEGAGYFFNGYNREFFN